MKCWWLIRFVEAIAVQRLAHELFLKEVPLIPRIMAEWAHARTGMELHPGAKIGSYFFVDHCTGTVVGETCIIGNHVKMYHGVTLGAKSTAGGQQLRGKKRHPTIEDRVTIYPGATILGGDTVIGAGSTIGGNVFIMESVQPNSLVIYDGLDMRVLRKGERARRLIFRFEKSIQVEHFPERLDPGRVVLIRLHQRRHEIPPFADDGRIRQTAPQCGAIQFLHGKQRERFLIEKDRVVGNARRLQFCRQFRPEFVVAPLVFRHDARLELHFKGVALHDYAERQLAWSLLALQIGAPANDDGGEDRAWQCPPRSAGAPFCWSLSTRGKSSPTWC